MELTDEDKKRIQEEEDYRTKIQQEESYRIQLRDHGSSNKSKSNSVKLIPLLVIIPIFVCYFYELNYGIGLITGVLLSAIVIILRYSKH